MDTPFFCTVYASGIQAASALRRGSMFDVMEQQRCYAAGQSPENKVRFLGEDA